MYNLKHSTATLVWYLTYICNAGFLWTETSEDIPCRAQSYGQYRLLFS